MTCCSPDCRSLAEIVTAVGWPEERPISAERIQGRSGRPKSPIAPSTGEYVRGARDRSGAETMFLDHEYRYRRHLRRRYRCVRGNLKRRTYRDRAPSTTSVASEYPAIVRHSCAESRWRAISRQTASLPTHTPGRWRPQMPPSRPSVRTDGTRGDARLCRTCTIRHCCRRHRHIVSRPNRASAAKFEGSLATVPSGHPGSDVASYRTRW